MRTKRIVALALGAAVALLCATCAPVEPTEPDDKDKPPVKIEGASVEKLEIKPTPVPQPKGPRGRIEAAIDSVRRRELRTSHGFWTIFHGILGLGPSVMMRTEEGERVNAVDYICRGGEMPGLEFVRTKQGFLEVVSGAGGPGVGQGHQDQFIAEMAQWGMARDRKFTINEKDYTFNDFIRHCQMRASLKKKQELSWAIVIVGQYLGTDAEWTNADGEKLRFQDAVRYELDANVENAACGGTHRLFGLTWTYHLHLIRGGKTEGVWKEIADKTNKYRDIARQYQNEDGSFSTDFFRAGGNQPDKQLRINTTGHTLEWLALALPREELEAEWIERAASALSLMILELQGQGIEGGGLYHAVHGLLIYYARVYDRKWLGDNNPLIPLPPDWDPVKDPRLP